MKSLGIKQILLNLFSKDKNPSGEVVAGFLGWIVCLIIVIYCQYFVIVTLPIVETLFWFSAVLLGWDSAMGTIRKREPIKENIINENK